MTRNGLTATQVLWTRPVTIQGKRFGMNRAEIDTMICSALMWRKYNGSIRLFTDNAGYEFLEKEQLLGLWDAGIDVSLLESVDQSIDPQIFWAAGKLMVLAQLTLPAVIFDTDLIVMQAVVDQLHLSKVTALHSERLGTDAYLSPELLKRPKGYCFPAYFNWEKEPYNTAFLYINHLPLRDAYVVESMRFMVNNFEKPAEMVSQMVFAEQRMLALCADGLQVDVNCLLNDPFSIENKLVIHLWGLKKQLRKSEHLQQLFSIRLKETLAPVLSEFSFFADSAFNDSSAL